MATVAASSAANLGRSSVCEGIASTPSFQELLQLLAGEHNRLEGKVRELTLEVSSLRDGNRELTDFSAGERKTTATPSTEIPVTSRSLSDASAARPESAPAKSSEVGSLSRRPITTRAVDNTRKSADTTRISAGAQHCEVTIANSQRRNEFRQNEKHADQVIIDAHVQPAAAAAARRRTRRRTQFARLCSASFLTRPFAHAFLQRLDTFQQQRQQQQHQQRGAQAASCRSSSSSGSRSNQLTINPEKSAFLERWDTVTIVSLTYVAIVAPVQVTMLQTQFDWLFCVNSAVDLTFIADMVLQFFLMYPIKTDAGYALEHRQPNIAKHYLKSWFFIDICSIIPWDLLELLGDSEEMAKMKAVKVIRLLRLLKLIRVLKASRVFHRMEVRMTITYGRLALLKFFGILLLIAHWMANLWALTLVLVDEEDGQPRWIDDFADLEQNTATMTKDSPAKLYITCMYFTSYTITSVGYGDIGPKNILERVVCTIMIVVSGISWAVVLGQVCGIVANLDADEQTFRQTMDELNCMMQDRHMPRPIRRRLRSFFLSNKVVERHRRHQRILGSISPGLQGEVVMELNRKWIMKVPFLRGIIDDAPQLPGDAHFYFMVDVSQRLECVVHAQSEIFGSPQVLYILARGMVGHAQKLQRAGSVWGTDFVLVDTTLAEPAECFAMTYVEVSILLRDDFMEVVQHHQASCPELAQRVRRFCIWLAFQRAIYVEAKRRAKEWSATFSM